MGVQEVSQYSDPDRLRLFMKCLLTDLRALEQMLADGRIESGKRRIGAEQELVLADHLWRPAPVGMDVLARLDDPAFTTEIGRFNIEFNLPPLEFHGDCLSRLEQRMCEGVAAVAKAAEEFDARVMLVGILPTIRKSDLDLSNMTPVPRYFALNDAISNLRGGAFEFRFAGTDELMVHHDSVMLEACNTSCQFHFQVGPEEFARYYNIAQAVAGVSLAAAVNSPLLFGRRLWRETRIAVFEQAVDTRRPGHQLEDRSARVRFGDRWIRGSVAEIFREDIARFRVVLAMDIDEDPIETLESGGIPRLKALQLHNSTVYRWMRACYGVHEGKPHLRIENRVFPAGPTVLDEVANAAFWFGLVSGVASRYGDITDYMDFDVAKSNFLTAARLGLETHLGWVEGRKVPAQELILRQLLPLAHEGLSASHIDRADADRYLSVIERRVSSGRTGAQWMLDSYSSLKGQGTRGEQLSAVTAATWARQQNGTPVHDWSLAQMQEGGGWHKSYTCVDQFMTTDVFSVHEDEVIDLVACLMDWSNIRHVPIEDRNHRLVGLISYRQLLRFFAHDKPHGRHHPIPAKDVMQKDPITIAPETLTLDAIRTMRERRVSCLPVVKDGRLVGIVTETDFLDVARQLLESKLQETVSK